MTRLSFAVMLLIGCGGGDEGAHGGREIRSVSWSKEPLTGSVQTVADSGDFVALFGDESVRVLVDGAIVASDAEKDAWRASGSIPAGDGTGTWIAAIDAAGHLRRVRADGGLEDLSARYDLTDVALTALGDLGHGSVAFAFAGGVAVADGTKVIRYDVGTFDRFAAGGGRFAIVDAKSLRVFDAHGAGVSFALTGARALTIDSTGRVFVATGDAVYASDGAALEAVSQRGDVRDVVSSAARTWILTGAGLVALDRTSTVESTVQLENGAHLAASGSGDVWVLGPSGVRRYTVADGGIGSAQTWQQTIAPIVDKSCSGCHLPSGSAHIDLSTYQAWLGRRDAILQRVVVERSMPPAGGNAITDADREAVRTFLAGP